jgi:hypothetical protein
LNRLDRYTADGTTEVSEVIGSEGQGLSLPTLGVKIPGGREQRKTGDLMLAMQRQREREQAPHAIPTTPIGPSATPLTAAKAAYSGTAM